LLIIKSFTHVQALGLAAIVFAFSYITIGVQTTDLFRKVHFTDKLFTSGVFSLTAAVGGSFVEAFFSKLRNFRIKISPSLFVAVFFYVIGIAPIVWDWINNRNGYDPFSFYSIDDLSRNGLVVSIALALTLGLAIHFYENKFLAVVCLCLQIQTAISSIIYVTLSFNGELDFSKQQNLGLLGFVVSALSLFVFATLSGAHVNSRAKAN